MPYQPNSHESVMIRLRGEPDGDKFALRCSYRQVGSDHWIYSDNVDQVIQLLREAAARVTHEPRRPLS